ncbi:MAG: fasciclin domain-containing protein, partial [Haloarcula sp.]
MKQTRRSLLRSIGAGTAVAVGGVGAASAKPPSEGNTIVDVAIAADGFDVLVAAVQEAGLVDALSGNRQLTVFAPTDDAFNAAGITVDNVDEVDDEFLLNVLTYHVIPGRRNAASITYASELPT